MRLPFRCQSWERPAEFDEHASRATLYPAPRNLRLVSPPGFDAPQSPVSQAGEATPPVQASLANVPPPQADGAARDAIYGVNENARVDSRAFSHSKYVAVPSHESRST